MSEILDNPNNYVNESEVSFLPVVRKYGLIMAAVSIIMTLVTSIIGMSNFALMALIGLLAIAIMIIVPVLGLKEHRNNELGGLVSFGRAFLVCISILAVSVVLAAIFNFVYMNFINPGYVETMKEGTREMLEKFNAPEEQIEKSLEPLDQMKTMSGNLISIAKSLGLSAVISLIIAAIMKRNRPIFN